MSGFRWKNKPEKMIDKYEKLKNKLKLYLGDEPKLKLDVRKKFHMSISQFCSFLDSVSVDWPIYETDDGLWLGWLKK